MATYRYYSADVLTGNVLAELPLYGCNFGRKLSAAGDFQGSFRLGSKQHNDTELLDGTAPEKTLLYVERDGTIIWGGYIWGRSYDSSQLQMSITGQTFESYFDRTVIENDFVRQNVDQLQIFKDLIDALQLQAGSNMGFDTSMMDTFSGINTTILVPSYEYHFAQETVSTLVSSENGFDYTIDVSPSATVDHPSKTVRVGYPKLGSDLGQPIAYDYPGSIQSYTWPESGGGTKFAVLGNGSGSSMLRAESQAVDLLNNGYPAWWIVQAFKSIATADQLTAKAAAVRNQFTVPISVPTFTLKSDRVPEFIAWSALGASLNVHIEDQRFPHGKDVVSRITGWTLQPGGQQGSEVLKFNLEGDDGSA